MLGVHLERRQLAGVSSTTAPQPASRSQVTTCLTDGARGRPPPRSPHREPRAATQRVVGVTTFASESWRLCATAGAAKPEKSGTWNRADVRAGCDATATSGPSAGRWRPGHPPRPPVRRALRRSESPLVKSARSSLPPWPSSPAGRRRPLGVVLGPPVDADSRDVDLAPENQVVHSGPPESSCTCSQGCENSSPCPLLRRARTTRAPGRRPPDQLPSSSRSRPAAESDDIRALEDLLIGPPRSRRAHQADYGSLPLMPAHPYERALAHGDRPRLRRLRRRIQAASWPHEHGLADATASDRAGGGLYSGVDLRQLPIMIGLVMAVIVGVTPTSAPSRLPSRADEGERSDEPHPWVMVLVTFIRDPTSRLLRSRTTQLRLPSSSRPGSVGGLT